MRPGLERTERQYEEISDGAKLSKLLEDYLDEYNMSHTTTMNLGGLSLQICVQLYSCQCHAFALLYSAAEDLTMMHVIHDKLGQ